MHFGVNNNMGLTALNVLHVTRSLRERDKAVTKQHLCVRGICLGS